jgi:LPXTG-motif cell wall-anchored protein
MPTDTTTSTRTPPTSDISASSNDSGIGSNRTLIITLSTVLSAVGLVLLIGAVVLYRRRRQHRLPFLSRGVSPIDDDEIERWKSPRGEKGRFQAGDTDVEADAALNKETGAPSSHAKQPSTSSVKKPPSVIVYNRPYDSQQGVTRHSTDAESRRSFAQNHPAYGSGSGKTSFDKALPQTPIQARAPNARAGLTDDSVPGDEPFLFSPKRTTSRRLSKLPPSTAHMGGGGRRAHHARARSSRSSSRSFGEYYYGGSGGGGGGGGSRAGSDLELSPRYSQDHVVARHSSQHSRNNGHRGSHSRVYSSSSIPPRLSFGDDVLFGGLSPARPRFPGEGEIGRAIG